MDNLHYPSYVYYIQELIHEFDFEYNYLLESGSLTCDADYDDEYITIVTAYIGNILKTDFIDDIHHEINHLLQYGKGFTKSNRVSNLYNTVTKIAHDSSLSLNYRVPSLLIYYTFRHEVDSFASQFYSLIKRSYHKASEIDTQKGFQKCIREFQPYVNLYKCIQIYNDNSSTIDVINGIKALPVNSETFELRIDKGVNRFMRKMRHVYQRCIIELRRGKTNERFKNLPLIISYGCWDGKRGLEVQRSSSSKVWFLAG